MPRLWLPTVYCIALHVQSGCSSRFLSTCGLYAALHYLSTVIKSYYILLSYVSLAVSVNLITTWISFTACNGITLLHHFSNHCADSVWSPPEVGDTVKMHWGTFIAAAYCVKRPACLHVCSQSDDFKQVMEALLEPVNKVGLEKLSQTRCASKMNRGDLWEVRKAFRTILQVKDAGNEACVKEEEFW